MTMVLALCTISLSMTYAQAGGKDRIEFNLDEGYSSFEKANFNENGILIYSEKENKDKKSLSS